MTQSADPEPVSSRPQRDLRLIFFVLIGLCFLFIAGYVQRQQEMGAVLEAIAAKQQQIDEDVRTQQELLAALEDSKDPAQVAAAARDELGMVLPGDQVIVPIEPPPTPTLTVAQVQAQVQPRVVVEPPWRQWMDLIFSSGGR